MLFVFILCASGCSNSQKKYDINAVRPKNGTYSISHKSATAGTKITITITPKNGYKIGSVSVTKRDSKTVAVSGSGKKRTFTMPEDNVYVRVSFVSNEPTTASTTTTTKASTKATTTTSTLGNVNQRLEENITINNAKLKFNGTLTKRTSTKRIILHHAASNNTGNRTVQDIHRQHQDENGWVGIGYHFYVRRDGAIWQGRPLDKVGAHAKNNNNDSIGICFEGNFDTGTMPQVQLEAGINLIAYIQGKYGGNLTIQKHSDVNSTSCPGTCFPWDKMVK